MADQAVGELIRATSIGPTDLFLLEQSGVAKSLAGQVLLNWLTAAADGHGGINKIEKLKTAGLVDTYRITLADTTTFDFTVNNGKSITVVSKTGTQGLVDTYTITYNDGQSTTFKVTNGAKGDKGDNAYTWIKYASQKPTESSHSIGDVPDNWIGVYTGNKASAPSDWKEYKWFQWKGNTGNTGDPARLVSQEVKYQVGDSGSIIPSGNWQSAVPVTPQGKYLWVRTTLTFNSGSPVVSYAVSHQGLDGSGSVSSVAGISPDPQGNVPLSASDVGALATTGGELTGPIQMNGQPISGLNPPKTGTEPVTKDDGDARYLQKAGGVPVPERDDQAVNRGYVFSTVELISTTGAGFHNSVYRGKNLGTSVTEEQYATIAAGEFNDLYIGDYWVINEVNWRIAAFDYYINSGDTNFTKHHVVIVPDGALYYAAMNNTVTTTGGYVGSEMRKTNLNQAKTMIKDTFGASHVLTKKELLTNAVSGNAPSGWAWLNSDVDLMSEVQVYGSIAWGTHDENGYNVANGNGQFPLFIFDRTKLHVRQSYWLRDVVSASAFSVVYLDGYARYYDASVYYGVRPAFCIGQGGA